MAGIRGADDAETAETVVLRTADGAWYELRRLDAERAAALERERAAGTDDVAGFSHGGDTHHYGELWKIGGDHRQWSVKKLAAGPDGRLTFTHTLDLAPPPSVRFPGGFPGVG